MGGWVGRYRKEEMVRLQIAQERRSKHGDQKLPRHYSKLRGGRPARKAGIWVISMRRYMSRCMTAWNNERGWFQPAERTFERKQGRSVLGGDGLIWACS